MTRYCDKLSATITRPRHRRAIIQATAHSNGCIFQRLISHLRLRFLENFYSFALSCNETSRRI